METQQQYLMLGDQVRKTLAFAGMSVDDLNERIGVDGLDTKRDPAHVPGEKSDAMVFFGSAAVIAAATPILIEIIRTLGKVALTRKEVQLAPVTDDEGSIVKDEDGKPIFSWHSRYELLESKNKSERDSSVAVKGLGVELEISKSDRVE